MADEVWIPRIVDMGMKILTTDDAMRRSEIIKTTIENNHAHVFASTNANLTAAEQSGRFQANQESIYRKTSLAGPCYCRVHPDHVQRMF